MASARKPFTDRLPDPRSAVPDSHFRGNGQPSGLDADQKLPPTLRAFADPDLKAAQCRPAPGRCADADEDTPGPGFDPGLEVTDVSPNADVAAMQTWAARGKIAVLPAIMILLPAGREARNHAGSQVRGVGSRERRQRLLKVAGRDAAQVKHRQQGRGTF